MHPILFKFGPITIYSYGLALFIAVLVSLNLAAKESQRQGLNKDVIFDLGIVILFSGIIGARILYILLNFDFYRDNPKEIFMLHHGGLAILGGIVLAVISGVIFSKIKKISFFRIADLIIPFVALGESIGRIGCFLNGCCYGVPSKFGIYFPMHNTALVPSQLISSFSMLLLYIILRVKQDKPHSKGSIFISYILYYSITRFFIEFIRGDSEKLFLGLTIFQYFCIALFVPSVVLNFFYGKKNIQNR